MNDGWPPPDKRADENEETKETFELAKIQEGVDIIPPSNERVRGNGVVIDGATGEVIENTEEDAHAEHSHTEHHTHHEHSAHESHEHGAHAEHHADHGHHEHHEENIWKEKLKELDEKIKELFSDADAEKIKAYIETRLSEIDVEKLDINDSLEVLNLIEDLINEQGVFNSSHENKEEVKRKIEELKNEIGEELKKNMEPEQLFKDKDDKEVFDAFTKEKGEIEKQRSDELEKLEKELLSPNGPQPEAYMVSVYKKIYHATYEKVGSKYLLLVNEIAMYAKFLEEKKHELEEKKILLRDAEARVRENVNNPNDDFRLASKEYSNLRREVFQLDLVVQKTESIIIEKKDVLEKVKIEREKIRAVNNYAEIDNAASLEEIKKLVKDVEESGKKVDTLLSGHKHGGHGHGHGHHELTAGQKAVVWSAVGGGFFIGMLSIFTTSLVNTIRGVKGSGGGGGGHGGGHGGGGHGGGGHGGGHH